MEVSTADNIIRDRLIQLNNAFSQLNITEHSPEVIRMFDELVTFCFSNEISSSIFNYMLEQDTDLAAACENLCRLFAFHGFSVELKSARICAADKNQNVNDYFKHRHSYEELIQFEMNILQEFGVHLAKSPTINDESDLLITKVAFIGSGPIPTSSMIILSDHGPFVDIYNIDMCEEANQLASIISEQVLSPHLSKRMHFITQDISQNPLCDNVKSILNQCQLIYLAAYVGMNELEKLEILRNIVNQSTDEFNPKTKQYFVIRTAEGLYQVLFPKIKAEKIAMLQATTNDINQEIKKKFLFQVKSAHLTLKEYGMVTIIAESI
ncbi:unnamed protein product [Adineta steineri]|uniref:Nicotianamine synthase n=1 Tax=Adineta steineri TaxID=433720 RepID=A0A814A928_9BILA|nr:unnamed protein product [Adineta steineri]CAF3996000.1 unnamed protein product [Adineta steineri]